MKKLIMFTAAVIWLLSCNFASGLAYDSDVSIHLNGGDDVVYAQSTNRLEIWITNEYLAMGMSLGFEFTWDSEVSVAWNMDYYGTNLPVMEHGDAIGCWDCGGFMQVIRDLGGESPDTLLIAGAAINLGLPAHYPEHAFCYSMEFYAASSIVDTTIPGGFCVDNVFVPPAGTWSMNMGGPICPDFNGYPNSATNNPDAPPICFDVIAPAICGDANGNGFLGVHDVVFLISYIFVPMSPAPDPWKTGDVDCSGIIDVSDAIYLLYYIFIPDSPAPCDPDGDGEPDC